MAELDDLRPRPQYVVAGATHPKVHERQGEAYRDMLVDRAARSRAAFHVSFDDTYRDLADLTDLIGSADVVVLPYDSADQVTSGVLVDAVAAGRPVIATAFPHAVELLASGAGIVVPQRDPHALAAAIRSVLTDPDLAASMAAEARRLAPEPVVGDGRPSLREVAAVITAAPRSASARRIVCVASMSSPVTTTAISFRHVQTLTDHIGMFEHADHTEPRRELGYCTDDVARLLIVLVREPDLDPALRSIRRLAFRFLTSGQSASGRMRNRRDRRGRWQDRAGVEDCWGRSVWAFGTAAAHAETDWLRAAALAAFGHGVQERSPHLRSMVFAALGAAEVLRHQPAPLPGARTAQRRRRRDRTPDRRRGLAVARATARLRERGDRRGADRRR